MISKDCKGVIKLLGKISYFYLSDNGKVFQENQIEGFQINIAYVEEYIQLIVSAEGNHIAKYSIYLENIYYSILKISFSPFFSLHFFLFLCRIKTSFC